jgi:DNA-binding response OmpR family regulator
MEMGDRHTADFNKAALEAQLVRLRKKLEQVGASTPVIKAIRGQGYQLCIAIEVRK